MKKVLFFIFLLSSVSFATGLYFSSPTSSSVLPIYAYGSGPINYNFSLANNLVTEKFYARLTYPDGSKSAWQTEYNGSGEIGGWWVTKAGTYQIEGKAYVKSIFGGSWYWTYTTIFSFSVIDNYAPAAPANPQVGESQDEHPILTWTPNTEDDFNNYKIYRKKNSEPWLMIGTTTSTNYTDYSVTTTYRLGDDIYYKISATDINNHESNFSNTVLIEARLLKNYFDDQNSETINEFLLSSNYPNPFNPSTKISYQIPSNMYVSLKVYNSLGQEIQELVNQYQGYGSYTVEFNANNLPSGIYFYKIQAGQFNDMKKMILTK